MPRRAGIDGMLHEVMDVFIDRRRVRQGNMHHIRPGLDVDRLDRRRRLRLPGRIDADMIRHAVKRIDNIFDKNAKVRIFIPDFV
jgi:hypothetical protein